MTSHSLASPKPLPFPSLYPWIALKGYKEKQSLQSKFKNRLESQIHAKTSDEQGVTTEVQRKESCGRQKRLILTGHVQRCLDRGMVFELGLD